jgi:hypothetical protein
MTQDLIALAERCEASRAEGGADMAYLDRDIHRAVVDPQAELLDAPGYTISLDAAMTLAPEGWHISFLSEDRYTKRPMLALGRIGDNSGHIAPCEGAETLPLALCAAALRARAGQPKGEEG